MPRIFGGSATILGYPGDHHFGHVEDLERLAEVGEGYLVRLRVVYFLHHGVHNAHDLHVIQQIREKLVNNNNQIHFGDAAILIVIEHIE